MKFHLKIVSLSIIALVVKASAQHEPIVFGTELVFNQLVNEPKSMGQPIKWINVNTNPHTWRTENDLLICSGQPIGVMRSEKQYENFILQACLYGAMLNPMKNPVCQVGWKFRC